MKPLHSIDTTETRLGYVGATACGLTRRLPASDSGAPFPFVPCQPPAKGAAGQNRLMTGTSADTGYFDAGVATPPERKRRPGASDNILLETGETQ
jgi:hypothetical protein